MPVLSKYTKQRIVALRNKGLSNSELVYELKREGIVTTPQSARRFYKLYLQDGTIARRQGSGRPSLLTDSVLAMVEELMRADDETTATQIHAYLLHRGQEISLPTIIRGRRFLGWTFRGTAYCQLSRDVNKQKRLEWARLAEYKNSWPSRLTYPHNETLGVMRSEVNCHCPINLSSPSG